MMDFKEAFAIPGADTIIDYVRPDTGRSWHSGQSLEEIRLRYPGAELVNIAEHCAAKAKRQDTPIEWSEVTAEKYNDMLNVLPPAAMTRGAFMVGEADDHHATSGRPRFSAFRCVGGRHETASRPMTHAEFCALFGKCSNDYLE